MRPAYVEEAARLLKKSLIHVETEKIVLDDIPSQNQQQPQDRRAGDASKPTETKALAEASKEQTKKPSGKDTGDVSSAETLVVSYEDYKRISNMLIFYLRDHDEQDGSVQWQSSLMKHNKLTFLICVAGITREDVLSWYLEQKADEFNSEDELKRAERTARLIIDRLVTRDGALLEDSRSGALAVHPSYLDD